MTELWLGIIAVVQLALIVTLIVAVAGALPRLREITDDIQSTLGSLQRALFQVEVLGNELRQSGMIDKLNAALSSAQGAAGKIEPLAAELETTLNNANLLLDDAKETSQSVRARVDDLAAVQSELTALASALTDVVSDVRDRELAVKLANVLADTSLLAADLGVLAENTTAMLETGKPLVSSVSHVVGDAKRRASGIGATLGSIKEGFKAGVENFRESRPE
jgi:hypothetical protein